MEAFLELFRGPGFDVVLSGIRFLAIAAPVWIPFVLLLAFWQKWITYRQTKFIAQMEWVFLEVRLSQDITRSPLAMELVLDSLQMGSGEDNIIEKYWSGGVRAWTSLELVSIEGSVHFIVRISKGGRSGFESRLYSQYPDVEVHEVSDYTDRVRFDEGRIKLSGTEMQLTKPDPYPIKTYVDYGLDKDPKEEQKIDPITPTLEWLGSLGKDEQAWIQILVRKHKKEDPKKWFGVFRKPFEFDEGLLKFAVEDRWKDDVKKEIEKIVSERKIKGSDEEENKIQLTTLEKDTITALERSVTKTAFDVGIRGIYLAKKEAFNSSNKGGIPGSFAQYGTGHLNGFKPNKKYKTGFDAAFRQDPLGIRLRKRTRIIFDAYKKRSYFHPPYKRKHFILNSEELATIYHFPGRVSTTPTFKRLESRKAEPPSGLPV